MSMNKDEIHPLRTGRAFFSRVMPGIRRLAALTRSPVPIAWEMTADLSAVGLAKAEGRVRGKSQNLGRRMLDVVGRWFLVVGAWMLGIGRLNCSRPARFARADHCSCPRSRLSRKSPYARNRGASRY